MFENIAPANFSVSELLELVCLVSTVLHKKMKLHVFWLIFSNTS